MVQRIGIYLLIFAIVFVTIGNQWANFIGLLILSVLVFFPEIFLLKEKHARVKSMLSMLSVNNKYLHVGMERVAISAIKKIALSAEDDHYAVLSFPYNHQISGSYRFPKQELDAVSQWFAAHVPLAEVIE